MCTPSLFTQTAATGFGISQTRRASREAERLQKTATQAELTADAQEDEERKNLAQLIARRRAIAGNQQASSSIEANPAPTAQARTTVLGR